MEYFKNKDNLLPDTKDLLNAIGEALGGKSELCFYHPSKHKTLKSHLKKNANFLISRICLNDLKDLDLYFDFLRELSSKNIQIYTHPDTMLNLDFKDVLVGLKDTPMGEESTCFYKNFEEFTQGFPPILRNEEFRVLKNNYGHLGENVYLVKFINSNQRVECIEALNNKSIKFSSIYEFLKFFEPKFKPTCKNKVYSSLKAGFVSCKYLPRISEGEISIILVKDRVVGIIKKTPKDKQFSTTLSSGANHIFESPLLGKYRNIVEFALDGLDHIEPLCKDGEFPLLWSMDFILDGQDGLDKRYILSDINCSCVDVSQHLSYCKDAATALEELL